ncbi:hypothetical protein COCSUDRAFT_58843 [Coccomyxa subellipsoidea C-169]|uniref:ubiquitinyl hydrolase 1 n=1 Tax=Coccomyxa subellipsoidea (strain C-169) TaxID=574566 RepID=I0Z6N4_COCSC|nr:hypothetical protein COCSUDRAFT_58843 [Coccomyxa subellipsoidea C-169]EIE26303.1 hypothetical protein COCSUDRAFT_58843 [Coccomyxa subellipsoidea C-169]|eukprot:XP_005650847.1 hypothetical protein COCSUDRAFT_58843 [Coccomyxa subellipsoidea C-169]
MSGLPPLAAQVRCPVELHVPLQGAEEAESALQRIFGGLLQSDVMCCACGHTSTALDPFLDISLDIKPPPLPPAPLLRPPGPMHKYALAPLPPFWILPANAQRRLSGAAAMAVAAAQKRAASVAGADPSVGTSGETAAPAGASPAAAAIAAASAAAASQLPDDRASPDTTATSAVGEAASAAPGAGYAVAGRDDSSESLDIVGSYTREPSPQGTTSPLLEAGGSGGTARRGSTEGDGYHSSAHEASAPPASTARGALSSEGASSGIMGDSQAGLRDEVLTSPAPGGDNAMDGGQFWRPTSAPLPSSTQRPPSAPAPAPARPRSGGTGKKQRPTRCMKCATCLKPQLKKACLRNKALRSAGNLAALDEPPPPVADLALPALAPLKRMPNAEEEVQGGISRSGSFTFPTRGSLPLPVTPRSPAPAPAAVAALAPAGPYLLTHRSVTADSAAAAAGSPEPAAAAPRSGAALESAAAAAAASNAGGTSAPTGVYGAAVPGGPGPVTAQYGAASLVGCLHRFVRPESLGPGERWTCERCRLQQRAVKQMSIRRLPPVLCLHVKRFEHMGVGKKLNTPLLFSAHLDVRPYLSSTVLQKRFTVKRPPERRKNGLSNDSDEVGVIYELYAVVCHRGNLQGGHYVAYVKCGNSWYLCDDGFVLEVDEATACSPNAYMLYYRHTSVRA